MSTASHMLLILIYRTNLKVKSIELAALPAREPKELHSRSATRRSGITCVASNA